MGYRGGTFSFSHLGSLAGIIMDMRHINCMRGSLMDMRGSKTVRQLKLVCHPEERRRGMGSGAEKGRKTIHRERRNVP